MSRFSRPRFSPLYFQRWGYGIFGLAIAGSLCHVLVTTDRLVNFQGLGLFGRFLGGAIAPDLTPEFLGLVGRSTLTTFAYAVCGTFLSLCIGTVGGLFTANIVWRSLFPRGGGQWLGQAVGQGLRVGFAIPRSIHELVWGLFLLNIWGLDSLVALAAIAIPFGAIVAKVFAEILDDTPRAGFEALIQAGVPPAQALLYGLLPQALFNLLSYGFYRLECSLRSAAVLGIIGAGGLGYEIYLSLQSLRYGQLWTLFYALVLLNGCVDWASGFLRQKLGCTSRLDLNRHKFKVNVRRRNWLLGVLVGGLGLVSWGFWYIQPDWQRLWSPRILAFAQEVGDQLQTLSPTQSDWGELAWLSLQTLEMSILAIALAGFGGIIFAFLAARNPTENPQHKRNPVLSTLQTWGSRIILLFCRGIPAPIWALVILFVTFPGILPGAIALGVHNLGILGRLMTEVIENLDRKPLDALAQLGSPPAAILLYGTLPLTLPNFIAYSFYRWEVCLRETVIVGLVGAGGLGRLLTEQLSSFDYGGVTISLGCFLVLTYLVDQYSHFLRQK